MPVITVAGAFDAEGVRAGAATFSYLTHAAASILSVAIGQGADVAVELITVQSQWRSRRKAWTFLSAPFCLDSLAFLAIFSCLVLVSSEMRVCTSI